MILKSVQLNNDSRGIKQTNQPTNSQQQQQQKKKKTKHIQSTNEKTH